MIQLCDTVYVKAEERESRLKDFMPSTITKDVLQSYPFELLTKTTKLFFDYDEHSDDKEYIQKTRTEIRNTLLQHCGHFKNAFVFTESIHPKKISFHVIFKKIHIIREHFQPVDEQELFEQLVGKERFKHIDTQVYGKKLWFRVPYGTTPDKLYSHDPVVPQGETLNLSDYMVSVPEGTQTKMYSSQLARAMREQLKKDAREYHEDEDISDDDKRKKMVDMIKLVKPERFKTYGMWLALMVVMKTHKLPRELFIEISQASGYERFDETDCIRAWNSTKENDSFGMGVIYGWLKKDGVDVKKLFPTKSPLLAKLIKDYFTQGEFTDKNIAEVIKMFYNETLFYTSSHGWIHYNGVKWVMGEDHLILFPLMKLITTDLLAWQQCELKKAEDDKDKKKAMVSMGKAINKIESAQKILGVIKILKGVLLEDNVLDTFDMKPNWVCFDNQKAIDLKTKEVINIVATDRILTTTGYDYVPRDAVPTEATARVQKILQDIMPVDELDLFLSNTSVMMYGGNTNEIIVVWKGVGRNGKGVVAALLKKVLGNYFMEIPIEELTQESKGTGRASSEIARLRWARCVCATEPEAGSRLIVSRIKAMTGKDTITVRHLHKESFSYVPKFTLLMQCNDMPVLSRMDEGIEERLKPQDFPHKFVDADELDQNPLYRLKDPKLKDTLNGDNDVRNAFLWMLIDAWGRSKGLYSMNARAKEEHQIIMKDNNPLTTFLEAYEPSESFIRIKVLHDEFKAEFDNKITPQKFKGLLSQAKVKMVEDKSHGTKVFIQKV